MTTRYVGIGGSDAANGLSWANRKLTHNGVEDTPVVAGDVIYSGPGTYRELLTLDVSGTAGNPITYIADVTGEHTDGVGGIVRITGSDNDQTATRANCITGTGRTYRTFRGFTLDTTTAVCVNGVTNPGNWIIEDCIFNTQISSTNAILLSGTGVANTVRRCIFYAQESSVIVFLHSATVNDTGSVVENCIFLGANGRMISIDRTGGINIKNSLFIGCTSSGVRVATALAVGQVVNVNQCVFIGLGTAVQATVAGELVENYCSFFACGTDRTNVNTGANSNVFPHMLDFGILLSGVNFMKAFAPAAFSPLRAIAGTIEPTDDLFGLTRPATSAKKSWGPVQFADVQREATTVRTGAASRKQADACDWQARRVPVTNVSTVISVYTRWETDYAGTKPQMVIKQPGQADITVTATGSSGAWELLTHTFTPSALPPYVMVILRSNNTATSGSYATYWDDLT